jgi:hypothetical protein
MQLPMTTTEVPRTPSICRRWWGWTSRRISRLSRHLQCCCHPHNMKGISRSYDDTSLNKQIHSHHRSADGVFDPTHCWRFSKLLLYVWPRRLRSRVVSGYLWIPKCCLD